MTSDAPDGRDAVRPVPPEPIPPPLIHSSDHRDPPARLLLPFTRCPRAPCSLRRCALALPCLPSPRAPPARRHFLALSGEDTSLSFDSPTSVAFFEVDGGGGLFGLSFQRIHGSPTSPVADPWEAL
jgi:hypothetical protein